MNKLQRLTHGGSENPIQPIGYVQREAFVQGVIRFAGFHFTYSCSFENLTGKCAIQASDENVASKVRLTIYLFTASTGPFS